MPSRKDYKDRAKLLKQRGFLSVDLRSSEFTAAQKSQISKLWAKYEEIATSPEKFANIRAGEKTKKAARAANIVTSKRGLWVPLGEFDKVKIVHRRGVPIIKKISAEKSSTEKLIHGVALLKELERQGKRKLQPNTYITVKIGENAPFRSVFRRPSDLLKYITEIFRPSDEDADIDNLIAHMSLVTFHGENLPTYKKERKKRKRGLSYSEKHARGKKK